MEQKHSASHQQIHRSESGKEARNSEIKGPWVTHWEEIEKKKLIKGPCLVSEKYMKSWKRRMLKMFT